MLWLEDRECAKSWSEQGWAFRNWEGGFPGGSVASAGDTGSIPDPDPTGHGATKPVDHNYRA